MQYLSHRSETGVCSSKCNRRMTTFSWGVNGFRVFLDRGKPPLEIVSYSSKRFIPFRLEPSKLSLVAVAEILKDEGFARLPRRADDERPLGS
jgi:hypothetical protein